MTDKEIDANETKTTNDCCTDTSLVSCNIVVSVLPGPTQVALAQPAQAASICHQERHLISSNNAAKTTLERLQSRPQLCAPAAPIQP